MDDNTSWPIIDIVPYITFYAVLNSSSAGVLQVQVDIDGEGYVVILAMNGIMTLVPMFLQNFGLILKPFEPVTCVIRCSFN